MLWLGDGVGRSAARMRFWLVRSLRVVAWRANCAMLYLRAAGGAARVGALVSAPAMNFRY